MKKKLIAISIVAVIAVIAIAGASLAYLTDTDSADNTFTVGNVRIKLVEQQRKTDADGNVTLEPFKQSKVLYPIVGSAQNDAKDIYGLTTAKNYVDKIVRVKNEGSSDAYVRVLIAVPADLEGESDHPEKNILHWNIGNKFDGNGQYASAGVEGSQNQATNEDYFQKCVYKDEETTVVIDGITYNIYSFTYSDPLKAGETTKYASFVGFYLDEKLDNRYDEEQQKIVYTINGVDIAYDLTQGVKIPVFAQAVQAAGFDSAAAAFEAADLPVNPWTTD